MKGALITISGFVQGVGFRQHVKHNARKLGLTGWVQNMPDGTVEAKAFGPLDAVHQLIEACKKGAFLSEVKEVTVEWIEEDTVPPDFSILHN